MQGESLKGVRRNLGKLMATVTLEDAAGQDAVPQCQDRSRVPSASPVPALHRPWQGSSRRVSIQIWHGNSGMTPVELGDVRVKDR